MTIILMKTQTQCLRKDGMIGCALGRNNFQVKKKELQSLEATWYARKGTGRKDLDMSSGSAVFQLPDLEQQTLPLGASVSFS